MSTPHWSRGWPVGRIRSFGTPASQNPLLGSCWADGELGRIIPSVRDSAIELAEFLRASYLDSDVWIDRDKPAPESLAELRAQHADRGAIGVSLEHSDRCLWSPLANRWARAWHDSVHLELGTEFSTEDEIRTGREQVSRALRAGLSARALLLLQIDTVGQSTYYRDRGQFPTEQHRFTLVRLMQSGHGLGHRGISPSAGDRVRRWLDAGGLDS